MMDSRQLATIKLQHTVHVIMTACSLYIQYHQRGWTMQEYCVSKTLFEVHESQPGKRTLTRSYSSKANEPLPWLAPFMEVRKWYSDNSASCRPFWLYNGLERGQASNSEAYKMYAELSAELHTEKASDKVRALLPLMSDP
eukprot:scaffold13388_cov35-Prasinocladus_malaysianus.AAC.1